MFMAVNRIRQSFQEMAVVVGDNALAERLTDMQPLINRGIVKMQSLYLEVEQEDLEHSPRNENGVPVKGYLAVLRFRSST